MVNVWDNTYSYEHRFREMFECSPPLPLDGDILDWGCSFGVVSLEIARAYSGRRVIGIDLDPSSIEYAIRNYTSDNLSFQEVDGFEYLSSRNRYGGIFALNNILMGFLRKRELLEDEVVKQLGKLMKSSLSSIGVLVVSAQDSFYDRIYTFNIELVLVLKLNRTFLKHQ